MGYVVPREVGWRNETRKFRVEMVLMLHLHHCCYYWIYDGLEWIEEELVLEKKLPV
jgi:hypothetical protein